MKNSALLALVFGVAVLLGTANAAKPPAPTAPQSAGKHDQSAGKSQANSSRGAELFATHCGRCHQPPTDLSPRTVPAVLAHMRARAMLSQKDEQELLKFLAP
jgi:cytochrome c5